MTDDITDLIISDPPKHALAARLEIESLRREVRKSREILSQWDRAFEDVDRIMQARRRMGA